MSRIEPSAGLLAALRRRIKRLFILSPRRDRRQQPERVVSALELRPGNRVADIGCGAGYFSFRLAQAVAPGGRVFAVDTDNDMLWFVQQEVDRTGLDVVPIKVADDDPGLPEPVNLLFLSQSYHHLPDKVGYMAAARRRLRPDGRVAVLEDRHDTIASRIFGHATDPARLLREMAEAGYRLTSEHDYPAGQSFMIFEASAE